MLKYSSLALVTLTSLSLVRASAEEQPSKPWQYSATLDTAYSDNLSHPASGDNLLRNFDTKADAFNFSGVSLDLQYAGKTFGFHVAGGYGDMYRTIGSFDPWRGANQYFTQFYGSYKPIKGSDLEIDFGKFLTNAGAEVPDILSNTNYSRSLLFVLGAPYYHAGVRAVIPLTKQFTAGVQVLNGWNNVRDNNTGKTIALTSALTTAKWSWSQTYIVGPEKTDSNTGFRHLYDTVFTATPRTWVQGYVEFLAGLEHRAPIGGVDLGRDHWDGFAISARFTPAKKFSLSPRWEYYSDATGFTTGLPQTLIECTGTAEYRPAEFMVWRLEYRADHSDRRFFNGESRQNQQTVLLALILNKRGKW